MAKEKMRIEIPRAASELLKLIAAIYKKHLADAANSPLKLLTDLKWETEGPKIALAQAKHDEAEMYKAKMEMAYKERDLIMANFPSIARSSRDLLKGINSKNMKRMSDWGYSVESSPAPKAKTSKTTDTTK